ncbi:MAG: hypothetical protein PW789_02635 [Edaphobacter sp.]|uniref:carboxypeptidase-like regulatory domain-containing protein n=1 Tax=Edaphobacter sp. TaxID=1934404 RepID=UPI002389CF73|nr:carboxypeptidase-like regulatory domain-containing protein [Edaphobacter sp.]MDE1175481.1 hypothetical protein [Edaphobacter sp.]
MLQSRRSFFSRLAMVSISTLVASTCLLAQDSPAKHGRKYKPPPETSKVTVMVTKHSNGKPIMNAAVVFNPFDKDGHDIGNLEVKTDPDGKATIDIIPTGSRVRVQVIATGFATFAQDYQIDDPSHDIAVAMLRPQEQVSSYLDNSGKASSRKAGVQEPIRPKASGSTTKPDAGSSNSSGSSSSGSSTTPAPQQ